MLYYIIADFLTEICATFLFVVIVGMTYAQSIIAVALAIGMGSALLITSEKAYMNPAVTVAVALCDPTMG